MGHYLWWIALSQLAWMGAFAGFSLIYIPMLSLPRVDGRPG